MRRSAVSILDELGITDPAEIDVEAIAYHCNAVVKYARLEACEARIVALGEHAIITVNERSRPRRQRFSVGHELGHWVGDRRSGRFFCGVDAIETPRAFLDPEERANAFAADLLMPQSLFEPRARAGGITVDTAEALADEFNCSLTAASVRLVQLGGRPAMVTCYDRSRRRWFLRSPEVPDAFWPVRDLQRDTEAFDLLKAGARPGSRSRPSFTPAELWIDRRDAGDYGITEQSIVVDEDVVLTILWWKNERQIVDYDE